MVRGRRGSLVLQVPGRRDTHGVSFAFGFVVRADETADRYGFLGADDADRDCFTPEDRHAGDGRFTRSAVCDFHLVRWG